MTGNHSAPGSGSGGPKELVTSELVQDGLGAVARALLTAPHSFSGSQIGKFSCKTNSFSGPECGFGTAMFTFWRQHSVMVRKLGPRRSPC